MIEFKDCIGKRVLIRPHISNYGLCETVVLEISPSGEFVRLQNPMTDYWIEIRHYDIIEILNQNTYSNIAKVGDYIEFMLDTIIHAHVQESNDSCVTVWWNDEEGLFTKAKVLHKDYKILHAFDSGTVNPKIADEN